MSVLTVFAGLSALALALIAGSASSQALIRPLDPNSPVHVIAHVDVTPDRTAQAMAAIRSYVAAARRQSGAIREEAIEEPRPNHFDLIEVWRDQAAYQAHEANPATIRFHDAIAPWRASPFEERLGTSITPPTPASARPGPGR
jgi:quinol monooxygenase YgiN